MRELCKVLVVDDELLVRQGIKHLLNWEQDGFQIVGEAGNGKEALALIRELKPHIVLTDIVMPVMDGEELTRLIKQHWPEIEVIVLSSFSEFDYVRSTFQSGVSDYILKPHLDTGMLLQVLRKTAEKIPTLGQPEQDGNYHVNIQHVLEKLLSRYETDVDPSVIQDWFPKPYFFLLGLEEPDEAAADDDKPLLESLKALMPGMKAVKLNGHIIPGRTDMTLFLLNVSREDRDQLPDKLKLLCPASQIDPDRILWMLSSPFESPERMRDKYESSFLKLLQYRFFLPRTALLTTSVLPAPSSAEPSAFSLQPFMERVRRLELEEAFQELQEHMDSHQEAYAADVFEFKSFIGNIVFNVIHLLGSMNYDMRPLDEAKYAYFKAIDEARHILDLAYIVEQFHAQVAEQVQANASASMPNPSMKLLLDYIDQHYMEPITLTGMAGHFHFNPSYLSSFFTAHHHEGFKEHLNRVRINKAADLLRYSETPISEIGSLVGYGDHSYFCKVFKKSMALSPTQYRRHHQA